MKRNNPEYKQKHIAKLRSNNEAWINKHGIITIDRILAAKQAEQNRMIEKQNRDKQGNNMA